MDIHQRFTLFVLVVSIFLSFVLRQLIHSLQDLRSGMQRELTGFARRVVEENPSLENYLNMGLLCFRCERFEEALEWFERLWSERVFRKEAGFWIVMCLNRLGKVDKARKRLAELPRESYSEEEWAKLEHALNRGVLGRMQDFLFRILTTQVSLAGPFLGHHQEKTEEWKRVQVALPARYQNLKFQNEDGLGYEFVAEDRHLNRDVLLKAARSNLTEEQLNRFLEHPRILARLSSRAFPQVYDLQQGNLCFYSLEGFEEGLRLPQLLSDLGKTGRLEGFLRLFLSMLHHLDELGVLGFCLSRFEPAEVFWDERRQSLIFLGSLRQLKPAESSLHGREIMDLFWAEMQCHALLQEKLPKPDPEGKIGVEEFTPFLKTALEEFLASRSSSHQSMVRQLLWVEKVHRTCIHALKGKFAAARRYEGEETKLIQTFFRETNLEDMMHKLEELSRLLKATELEEPSSRLPVVDELTDLNVEFLNFRIAELKDAFRNPHLKMEAVQFLKFQNLYFDRLSDRLAQFLQEHGLGLISLLEEARENFVDAQRVEIQYARDLKSIRLAVARPQEIRPLFLLVLENLMHNALDAGAARIVLRVLSPFQGRVEILLEDDGSGIPPHLLQELKSSSGYRMISQGGTGLIASRKQVEAAGGSFRIEAREDGGTRVGIGFACYIA